LWWISLTQNEKKEKQTPPISQTHFAWASVFTGASLLLFLAFGDYEAVQLAAIAMAGLRATSWYYYGRPTELFFAIVYLGLVAAWQFLL
jgi:hypothetical protein